MNSYNMRQNHPELVVRDLVEWGVPESEAREILKQRGINKWLCVRRLLIQLKERWKGQVTKCQEMLTKGSPKRVPFCNRQWVRGYLAATEAHRAQVRALCHSDRNIDFPRVTSDWPVEAKLPPDFAQPQKNALRKGAQ